MFITDFIRRRFHHRRYALVKDFTGPGGTDLLDIGCGRPCSCMSDGSFIEFVGGGVGVDVKDSTGGFPFVKARVENLPFKDKSFSKVVALEVLEHLTDPGPALSEISRVLSDGGVFVVTTPSNNLMWNLVWFFWVRTFGLMWKESHKINLSEDNWRNLLGKHFNVTDVQVVWGMDLVFRMCSANPSKTAKGESG